MCYSSEDTILVHEVYKKLKAEEWISPWFNKEEILPGQAWEMEIERTLEKAGAVIVFISNNSVRKEGYVQKELKLVLDNADKKPYGTIFVIPLCLDDCTPPNALKQVEWANYFPLEKREEQYQRVLRSLKIRYDETHQSH